MCQLSAAARGKNLLLFLNLLWWESPYGEFARLRARLGWTRSSVMIFTSTPEFAIRNPHSTVRNPQSGPRFIFGDRLRLQQCGGVLVQIHDRASMRAQNR